MTDLDPPYEPLPDDYLREQWLQCFGHRENAAPTFDALIDAYRKPGRFYHTLEHAHEVAIAARSLCPGLSRSDSEVVCLAAWTHDAYYDRTADDNEAKSAAIAVELATQLGLDQAQTDLVNNLIMVSTHRETPKTLLEKTMCDADLSVLAKPWDGYQYDVENIRAELGVESTDDWNAMRLMILDFFKSKAPLYYLDEAADQWQAAAAANFKHEQSLIGP